MNKKKNFESVNRNNRQRKYRNAVISTFSFTSNKRIFCIKEMYLAKLLL